MLPHVHIRTARVVSVLACTDYSSLFDSYILFQVESDKNNCFFRTFYFYHSNGFKPAAILPIGTYVANIIYILILSYRIWCLASLANHRLSAVETVILDQIAVLDADHGPEIKQAIREAQDSCNSFKMLFWVPLSIRGHTILVHTMPGS